MKGSSDRGVREHMDVFGSCGNQLGVVDHVEGDQIKLTKSGGDDRHHWIPMSWVESVDSSVRLSKDCEEATREWRSEPAASGANNVM